MMKSSLLDELRSNIRDNELFSDTDGLLVAVSGGKDSMCLLHCLSKVHKGKIEVAHVNYQLRGRESDLDEETVRNFCDQLGFKVHVKKTPLSADEAGIQEKARSIRYTWFTALLEERALDIVLTAHHLNDQMETVLHHLIRGSGLNGLRGMPFKKGQLIRPFINLPSSQIDEYRESHDIPFREDASNKKSDYTRNFIRNEIISRLDTYFDQLYTGFGTSLKNLKGEYELLQSFVSGWAKSNVVRKGNYYHIPLKEVLSSGNPESLLFQLLEGLLGENEILQLLSPEQAGTMIQKAGFDILRGRTDLIIRPYTYKPLNYKLTKPGVYELPAGHFSIEEEKQAFLTKNNFEEYIPFDPEIFPITIRNWREGDHFIPLGMNGKQKKLSDYFIDEKLHRFEKEEIPLLLDKDRNIIWIMGMRLSEKYRIKAESSKFYKLSYSKSNSKPVSQVFKHFR